MLIEYECVPGRDYRREAVATDCGPYRQWALTAALLTGLAGASALAGGTPWAVLGGLLTTGVAVAILWSALTITKADLRRPPPWSTGTARYRLDDDGLTAQTAVTTGWYAWSLFTTAREARHGFHCHRSKRLLVALPYDGMTPDQRADLRAFLIERDLLRPRPLPTRRPT